MSKQLITKTGKVTGKLAVDARKFPTEVEQWIKEEYERIGYKVESVTLLGESPTEPLTHLFTIEHYGKQSCITKKM